VTLAFLNVGFWEFVVIVLAVMFIFGPKRIPEVARTVGRVMREFRKVMADLEDELRSETGPIKRDAEDVKRTADLAAPASGKDEAKSSAMEAGPAKPKEQKAVPPPETH